MSRYFRSPSLSACSGVLYTWPLEAVCGISEGGYRVLVAFASPARCVCVTCVPTLARTSRRRNSGRFNNTWRVREPHAGSGTAARCNASVGRPPGFWTNYTTAGIALVGPAIGLGASWLVFQTRSAFLGNFTQSILGLCRFFHDPCEGRVGGTCRRCRGRR